MGKTAQTNVVIANNNRAIIQMVPVYPDAHPVIKEKRAKKRHGYILIKKNIKMLLIII